MKLINILLPTISLRCSRLFLRDAKLASLYSQLRASKMTIEDQNDEDFLVYKGIQRTVKAKVVNLLQQKLEAQDASDESSDK